jgi:hypothetical protein
VSGFEASWLALREPADHAARSTALAARFAAALGERPRLLDLGAGTGANFRYLAPRLGTLQDWLLIDHDSALGKAAAAAIRRWAEEDGWSTAPAGGGLQLAAPGRSARVAFQLGDLADGWPDAAQPTAITASALLDLASAAWLDRLAQWCRGLPLLVALSVEGSLAWHPEEPGDQTIRLRFLAHQRRDKGFGPALGPDAPGHLAQALEAAGHRVELTRSDWRLGPQDAPLLGATLAGIVAAAGEIAADPLLECWAATRRD